MEWVAGLGQAEEVHAAIVARPERATEEPEALAGLVHVATVEPVIDVTNAKIQRRFGV